MPRSMLGSVKNKLFLSRKGSTHSSDLERPSRTSTRTSIIGSDSPNPFRHTALSPPISIESPPEYSLHPPADVSAPGIGGSSNRRGASPVPSIASITSDNDKYAFLSTFDTVFVIDDSGSMAGSYWREVEQALLAITPICTEHDRDGIDVFFLNHKSGSRPKKGKAGDGYTNITNAADVTNLFRRVQPRGLTPTGSRLRSILKPYLAELNENPNNMEDIKPVNIIVVTDGSASDDPESIIVQYARMLDRLDAPLYQVGIQFFQVGSDPSARQALEELDDGLSQQGVRDMVDTVSWDERTGSRQKTLSADGILKTVLGAVVRRLDRKAVRGGR